MADKQYLELVRDVLENGTKKGDRTGTGTRSVTCRMLRFDISKGFPLLTTKKVHYKSVLHELLWFIKGDTNTKYLNDNGVRIWNEWSQENGDLGKIYGHQWRNCNTPDVTFDCLATQEKYIKKHKVDQLQNAVERIKTNPECRRNIVMSWNVADLPKMALPPCHYKFQFVVQGDKLDLSFNMRSCDVFLGLPFNIASYATLLHMVSYLTNYKVGELVVCLDGDVHIYENHVQQCFEQLKRDPYPLPQLEIIRKGIKSIDDFKYEDIKLIGYKSHPTIKGKVAV